MQVVEGLRDDGRLPAPDREGVDRPRRQRGAGPSGVGHGRCDSSRDCLGVLTGRGVAWIVEERSAVGADDAHAADPFHVPPHDRGDLEGVLADDHGDPLQGAGWCPRGPRGHHGSDGERALEVRQLAAGQREVGAALVQHEVEEQAAAVGALEQADQVVLRGRA